MPAFCNNTPFCTTIHTNTCTVHSKEVVNRFEAAIKAHELLLRKVCRMYAAHYADRQDLFQEIVLQLWKAYPTFKGDAKLSTWMYRVAINTAITGIRKKKDTETLYEPSELPVEIADEPAAKMEEERLHQFYHAVGKLNEIERAIVMLYLEQKTYEEMEEILGISQGNLRVKMNRVKEKLRELTKQ